MCVDEAPLEHRHLFEGPDNTLRDIMDCDELLDCRLILLSDGLYVKETDEALFILQSTKSYMWQHCTTYKQGISLRSLNQNVNNTDRERFVSFSTVHSESAEARRAHDAVVEIPNSACLQQQFRHHKLRIRRLGKPIL